MFRARTSGERAGSKTPLGVFCTWTTVRAAKAPKPQRKPNLAQNRRKTPAKQMRIAPNPAQHTTGLEKAAKRVV